MKKFLLILLIALVASSTITLDTEDLNSIWDTLKDWADKIGDFVKKLSAKAMDAYNWLKDNGYWDQLVDLVKQYGKPYAVEFCVGLIKIEFVCSEIVDKIFDML